MPESTLTRYLNHSQCLRMKARLEHAIAMIRAEFEQEPGTDPRGVEAELVMLLARTAATMGMDITAGAATMIARLQAELERAKVDARGPAPVANGRHAPLEIDRERFLANGSHNGTERVPDSIRYAAPELLAPYDAARAQFEAGQAAHPDTCRCSACRGSG